MLSNKSSDMDSEIIRQHGREELEDLRARVMFWKEDFLRQAPAGGGPGWIFLVREFHAEIDEWLYPYVRRMIDTEHISASQAAEFMDYCYSLVMEVAEHLGITGDESNEGESQPSIPLIYK